MRGDVQSLSDRERETLRFLVSGHDAKSLARHFGVSVHTINDRLRAARRKLGVSSSREAARLLNEFERAQPNFSVGKEMGVADTSVTAARSGPRQSRLGEARSLAWFAGGMITVTLVIATTALLMTLGGRIDAPSGRTVPAAAAASAINDRGGADAAKAWLVLLDRDSWAASWSAAGSIFQSRLSEPKWETTIQSLRQSMGAVKSRTLADVNAVTSLPGVADGDYEIVQFKTAFTDKSDAIETVILAHEHAGWKVDGYYIR